MAAGPQSTTSVATFAAAEAIVWLLELEELLELLELEELLALAALLGLLKLLELAGLFEPPPPHPTAHPREHPIAIAIALEKIRRTYVPPTGAYACPWCKRMGRSGRRIARRRSTAPHRPAYSYR